MKLQYRPIRKRITNLLFWVVAFAVFCVAFYFASVYTHNVALPETMAPQIIVEPIIHFPTAQAQEPCAVCPTAGPCVAPYTRVSPEGETFILSHEGFCRNLCDDVPGGHCSIGYGHLVHTGPCVGPEKNVTEKRWAAGISTPEAVALFESDLRVFERGISVLVTVPLNQCQYDALVSFTYNIGLQRFVGMLMLDMLNQGKYETVPIMMQDYVWAAGTTWRGLVTRRKNEGLLFSECMYEAQEYIP